jgi:energy-coupling factor transporter ATP-binding protein EcfA2
VSVFDFPAEKYADEPEGVAEPAGKPTKDSTATALVRLALDRYRLGLSADDDPFAVALDGPRIVRALRGGKGSLRAELADAYYADVGKVAAQQALADALLVLEGRAQHESAERLHLRVAEVDGVHYLDLGDVTGRAVRITAGRWHVVTDPPVLFRRTQLTGALPAPEPGGTLDELWTLLNVAASDRPLVLAWLVAALLPDVPHPVLALRGEQGSGKSTATRTLAGLLDPSPAQVRKPPRDVDGWVTAASGSWVVGIDNVSELRDWWSDALCRAVTGDGDVRRRLYSDADLAVFSFRRVILLNGIDLGAVRDDLAERLLTVELHRITERGRKLDADLAQLWTAAHPRLLGALLTLAAQVLDRLPEVRLDRLPRMADFARVLAAVDEVLGTEALTAYGQQAGDLAADAVDSDPVLAAIVAAIREPWTGPAGELLDLITPSAEGWRAPKDWPKDSRVLTGLLRRRSPSLRRLGWTVDDLGRGGKDKLVRFRMSPPVDDLGIMRDSPGVGRILRDKPVTQAGDEAGDSTPRRATSPARRATADDVARRPAGLWPAETPDPPPEAGDAGDIPRSPLLDHPGERDESGAPLDAPFLSPATPATPAGHASGIGPCARCGGSCKRYGDGASPLCTVCQGAAA